MTKVNHDLRSNQGRTIYMPEFCAGEEGWGNLNIPDVYTLDTAQKYPHGTAFRAGERTWFYAQYKGSVNMNDQSVLTQEAADNYMFGRGLQGRAFQKDYAASNIYGVEGEPTVYIITAANVADVVMRANDFYSGGYCTIRDATHTRNQFMGGRVIEQVYSVTTLVVGGHDITTPSILTLDHNLPANVTWATAIGTVMPNKWKHAVQGQDTGSVRNQPVLGASCVGDIDDWDTWLWLQTHGEIQIGYAGNDLFGDTNDYQVAVWNADGAIDPIGYATAYMQQIAGFVVSNSHAENATPTEEKYPVIYLTMIP